MRPPGTTCPPRADWLRFVDGEVTENHAAELRAHASGCSRCARELAGATTLVSRIGASVPGLPSEGALASVMARLDVAPPAPRQRHRAFLLGGASALAAAAALLLAIRPWPSQDGRGAFAARGGEAQWARKVSVELWALEEPPRRLVPGGSWASGTPLVANYRNLDAEPAWLLAFALDPANEVHWLYPAFLQPGADPMAPRLEPSVMQRAFPDAAVLEDLPPGPVRIVLLVVREPLRVSDIERLAPAEREPDRLRARWPQARIDVLAARLDPRPGPGGAR